MEEFRSHALMMFLFAFLLGYAVQTAAPAEWLTFVLGLAFIFGFVGAWLGILALAGRKR